MRWMGWRVDRRLAALVVAVFAFAGLLTPVAANAAVAARICHGSLCDGADPAMVPPAEDRILQPVWQWSRRIDLHLWYRDGGMAWANISNGSPGDQVWLNRRISGQVESEVGGRSQIPPGWGSWRTLMYWVNNPGGAGGQVQACGKAGDRVEVSCTDWLPECVAVCDGADPAGAPDHALQPTGQWFRDIVLHWTPANGGMAWASIGNGLPGDEVWLDRSWNGGVTWQPRLG